MANITSQHILNTSANLLGFCLFVITSLHVANRIETHIIDELTAIVAVFLTFSCVVSFISLKTTNQRREQRLEAFANYMFIISLIGILVIILLITLNIIR